MSLTQRRMTHRRMTLLALGSAAMLGVLSLPLIALYPVMKRITWWPQLFLGIVFNFGALMGWSAVTGVLALPAILLYAAGICWTLGYDTIYANQDKDDDMRVGIKSTALKFGGESWKWVTGFYLATFLLLYAAFIAAGAGWLSLLLSICRSPPWRSCSRRPRTRCRARARHPRCLRRRRRR